MRSRFSPCQLCFTSEWTQTGQGALGAAEVGGPGGLDPGGELGEGLPAGSPIPLLHQTH